MQNLHENIFLLLLGLVKEVHVFNIATEERGKRQWDLVFTHQNKEQKQIPEKAVPVNSPAFYRRQNSPA